MSSSAVKAPPPSTDHSTLKRNQLRDALKATIANTKKRRVDEPELVHGDIISNKDEFSEDRRKGARASGQKAGEKKTEYNLTIVKVADISPKDDLKPFPPQNICVRPFYGNSYGSVRCGDCNAVYYCSEVCRAEDSKCHKIFCKPIMHSLRLLEKEAKKLREHRGDDKLPTNLFETMQGMDQKAYDFIKWWAVIPNQEGFEWSTFTGPHLNFENEDLLESIDIFLDNRVFLSLLISLTNIKLRILLDLRMLEREIKKYGTRNASYETKKEWVEKYALSDFLYNRMDIIERNDWRDLVSCLNNQVKKLYNQVHGRNKGFWHFFVTFEERAFHNPPVSLEEWTEPEVIELVRQAWSS
ncbi:hypothetical protein F5Y11DRAFT_362661 [Daldinia sp. FL1419]|nr:hypothetical protein F5Y11DRAFT_362661 [Daldinia sp. FL1419]